MLAWVSFVGNFANGDHAPFGSFDLVEAGGARDNASPTQALIGADTPPFGGVST